MHERDKTTPIGGVFVVVQMQDLFIVRPGAPAVVGVCTNVQIMTKKINLCCCFVALKQICILVKNCISHSD